MVMGPYTIRQIYLAIALSNLAAEIDVAKVRSALIAL